MSVVKPGDAVNIHFAVQAPSSGAATDADSTPSVTLVRNGSDTAESVTVTNIETGVYNAAVTIPAGYSAGDEVQLRASATVSGTTGKAIIWQTTIDTSRVSEVGGTTGSGSESTTITIDDGSNPVEGAAVWVSTDAAGSNVVAGTLYTNTFGRVTFLLDPGDYYRWVQHSNYNFTNPVQLTVS